MKVKGKEACGSSKAGLQSIPDLRGIPHLAQVSASSPSSGANLLYKSTLKVKGKVTLRHSA